VCESLQRLRASRIVIAHRLSTIRQADRIYVLQAGKFVQVGKYHELLEQEGTFRKLALRQLT
jgi:ABC-type multidrug transport system fused ATPase/permease subunit